jgi:hypothetical protein
VPIDWDFIGHFVSHLKGEGDGVGREGKRGERLSWTYPLVAGPRIHSKRMSSSIKYLFGVVADLSVPVKSTELCVPARMKQLEEE